MLELDLNPRHQKVYQTYLQRERQKVLGLLDDMTKNRFEIFRSLTLLRQASLDVSLVDDTHSGVPSTKLDALMEMLDDIVERRPPGAGVQPVHPVPHPGPRADRGGRDRALLPRRPDPQARRGHRRVPRRATPRCS